MDQTQNLRDAIGILAKAASACFADMTVPHELYNMVRDAKNYIGQQLTAITRGE